MNAFQYKAEERGYPLDHTKHGRTTIKSVSILWVWTTWRVMHAVKGNGTFIREVEQARVPHRVAVSGCERRPNLRIHGSKSRIQYVRGIASLSPIGRCPLPRYREPSPVPYSRSAASIEIVVILFSSTSIKPVHGVDFTPDPD